MKVTPIREAHGGWPRQDFSEQRDRLIYIIDELIMASSVPNSYRFITSSGQINIRKCQALIDFLKNETDDRLVRIRNLASRLFKILSR